MRVVGVRERLRGKGGGMRERPRGTCGPHGRVVWVRVRPRVRERPKGRDPGGRAVPKARGNQMEASRLRKGSHASLGTPALNLS